MLNLFYFTLRTDLSYLVACLILNVCVIQFFFGYYHFSLDEASGLKRKANDPMSDDDSGGYNTDDDEGGKVSSKSSSDRSLPKVAAATSSKSLCTSTGQEKEAEASSIQGEGSKGGGKKKKKKLDEGKREERNAREKERSFRIAKQINELRGLLSSGGVIVPKGTKSSVLTEAANYIRMLQQHQYRSEM